MIVQEFKITIVGFHKHLNHSLTILFLDGAADSEIIGSADRPSTSLACVGERILGWGQDARTTEDGF
jgi:hypothetical protein